MSCPAESGGDLGAAGEGVEERWWGGLCEESFDHHAVGPDAVDEERESGPARRPKVGLKDRDLALVGSDAREVAEVQAALADRDEARRPGPEGVEEPAFEVLVIVLGKIAEGVRVDSESSVKAHAWRFRAQRVRRCDRSRPRSWLHPGDQDRCDFRILGAYGRGSLFLRAAEAG